MLDRSKRRLSRIWLLDRHHTQLSVAAAGVIEAQHLGTPHATTRSWRSPRDNGRKAWQRVRSVRLTFHCETSLRLSPALHASGDVPLEVMRLCAQGLEVAATVAAHGVRAASADVQLAVAPLQAGSDGARSDLEAKLSSFTDAAYVTSVADEIVRLPGNSTASTCAAESLLKALPA